MKKGKKNRANGSNYGVLYEKYVVGDESVTANTRENLAW